MRTSPNTRRGARDLIGVVIGVALLSGLAAPTQAASRAAVRVFAEFSHDLRTARFVKARLYYFPGQMLGTAKGPHEPSLSEGFNCTTTDPKELTRLVRILERLRLRRARQHKLTSQVRVILTRAGGKTYDVAMTPDVWETQLVRGAINGQEAMFDLAAPLRLYKFVQDTVFPTQDPNDLYAPQVC